MVGKQVNVKGMEAVNLVSVIHLLSVPHLVSIPHLVARHTPVHNHTMEKASQTADEMCLDTGYDMGFMAHNDAGPSHTFSHRDTS